MSSSSKREALGQLLGSKKSGNPVNTELQEYVNTDKQGALKAKKKKATFDFDPEFHRQLKTYAASMEKDMVDVVVAAVKEYIQKYTNT